MKDNDSHPRCPLILVSNDDGYRAPGVHHLTSLLSEYGHVVAVCPEGPQSGKSMAITVNEPLRLTPVEDYRDAEPGVEWYHVNGTPADCIKIAMHTILADRRPDLICTGINHGSNASVNVVYSGTMGAAFEGCAFGIPSVGFSLCDHSRDADFSPMLPYVRRVVEATLRNGLPKGICLNVNAPDRHDLKGMCYAPACKGHWSDEYREYTDPQGRPYYWMTGRFINEEPENPHTDDALLACGYVTVTACTLDPTAHAGDTPAWLTSL